MPSDDARWGEHAARPGVPGPFKKPCSNKVCLRADTAFNHCFALCGRKNGGIDVYKACHPNWRERL